MVSVIVKVGDRSVMVEVGDGECDDRGRGW